MSTSKNITTKTEDSPPRKTEEFPGHNDLFDDDDDDDDGIPDFESGAAVRTITGGGDPAAFISLATRIRGLRMTPTSRDKIPLEKGWNREAYWDRNADIVKSIGRWPERWGRPNSALCLGPACGPDGDLVIEADNQAGDDLLQAQLPSTPICTRTRLGFLHRHFKPDIIDIETGAYRGNRTDLLGSKKRWAEQALAAGFRIRVPAGRERDDEALAYVAHERARAEKAIAMGPLVDIKCVGGLAMAPGSVHACGHIYAEVEPWSLELWSRRPLFDPKWFADAVWSSASIDAFNVHYDSEQAGIDSYWTPQRKYEQALKYVRKVPPKSTGENASATAMRLATVLVRGFVLEVPQARELMTYWAREVCGHEPWTRREIEHKLREAQDRGRMAWGEFLRRPRRNAWLETAERRLAERAKALAQAKAGDDDHVSVDDLVVNGGGSHG